MSADTSPPVQAAADLARTLRRRGLVAAGSAGIDGVARVVVFSRSTARLTGQAYLVARDSALWFNWADEPPCPVDDLIAAADMIIHALTARTDPVAIPASELARREFS